MNEREPELTRTLCLSLRHDEVLAYQRPLPEAVLAAIRPGQAHGEFDPAAAAEVLTAAVYFDTLTRRLTRPTPRVTSRPRWPESPTWS
jgi:hypothetical protein